MQRFSVCWILLHISFLLIGQKQNAAYRYHIKRAQSSINIDGEIGDAEWSDADVAKDFHMILPMDSARATVQTEVRMCFDNDFIYISAINYIPHETYIVESLRRDWSFGSNDNFLLTMDTYNDLTNGFAFGLNAAGAQWDGQQYDGGSVNLNWDNKWYSKVKQYKDRWTFEAAIPFKSIRFNKSLETWGINFGRMDLPSTEKSSWAPVPRQFPSIASAYTGTLVWDELPPTVGSNISVIPYFSGASSKNFETEAPSNSNMDAGFDAKFALGSALNLDVTVNPDFSQVEVDQQQTNLDRFELFFPEKRQFFLENDDLFNNLGMDRIRPFFSRRIGLDAPIDFGARVSGKLNNNLRIGAMDIKTGRNEEGDIAAQNFSVVTLQQRVFARSNVTAFVINKSAIGEENFNRNIGLEYNLASKNNAWKGKFLYYNSANELKLGKNATVAGQIGYSDRHWNITSQYEKVGANYDAQAGFFQRKDYDRMNTNIGYLFIPSNGHILTHGPSFFNNTVFGQANGATEHTTGILYNIEFRNKSKFWAFIANDHVQLLNEFDPTNFTRIVLEKGSIHGWRSTGLNFNSKPQSVFTYGFNSRYGGYFADGTRLRLSANVNYRFQPYVQLSLAAEFNDIDLPESQGLKDARFWLVSPKLDITLTNNFYFTTFVQYNEQIKNTNLNARLQWRYQPASDLFLVYTDNYANLSSGVKNRAVVLKMTYWWNI
ncbi:MAG: hypothetical protein ACJA01_001222 [Saprospiraceae bacterium]|jgi:hypothetical protein